MSAHHIIVFNGARNVHVCQLRKNVRAKSDGQYRTGFLHFFHKNRPRIIIARDDALKIISDEGLERVILDEKICGL